jgi:hypothetical protein
LRNEVIMPEPAKITCSVCHRERGPEDTLDYHPVQVLTGRPLGWYSGDDGEVCAEDMTKMLRNQ